MTKISFDLENLGVDWISFNLPGLTDPKRIADRLLSDFNVSITIDDESKILFSDRQNSHNVSIRQHIKSHWVGTQIIFSGKNAAYFYKLIKTQKFDLSLLKFDQKTISLGRIDLCFSKPTDSNHSSKSFDAFLIDSRSKIQSHTTTRHIKLQDFPGGKMLKVNRRSNSRHYRVYQKDKSVRFELELKHRQTKLIQEYLFKNQLDVFEYQLVLGYFQYSEQVLSSDSQYTSWIIDFQRRHQSYLQSRSLVTSYLKNQMMTDQKEEERMFHLLQFLSFLRSLELNAFKNCKKHRIRNQFYCILKFPLSQFVRFTGVKLSNYTKREKLILYFQQLQKLDPIVKVFSNKTFQSYVCFPYVGCENTSGTSWLIEVFVAEELFCFPYPFQLPNSFLHSVSKNDLRLKIRLIKSLATSERNKTLDLEEFFNTISLSNNQLIQIKKNIIQLLNNLVENMIIKNGIEILLKSGKKINRLIRDLSTSDITRRIKLIKFYEIIG